MSTATILMGIAGLRRAWPHRGGGLSVELRDRAGRLRAARVTPTGSLHPSPFATDPRLPALHPGLGGTLVVHRLHRRAVVLTGERAIKLLRPGRAQEALGAHRALEPLIRAAGLGAARILDSQPARIDTALLPGSSLYSLGEAGRAGWEALAAAWPGLVAGPAGAEGLAAHRGGQEAAVLWQWFTTASRHGLLPAPEALGRQVTAVCRALEEGGGTLVPAHRDLHDAQLLWDGSALSLLDLDTACRAEAALDLGNLLAHVELAGLQGRLGAAGLNRVLGLLEAMGRALPTSPERVSVYRQGARLRLACVHAYRPSAWPWLADWVDHCLSAPIEPTTTMMKESAT